MPIDSKLLTAFREAVETDEADGLRTLLTAHDELRQAIDEPWFSFDAPAIVLTASRGSRPVLEVLLQAGADIDAKSAWGNGPFGVLHHACFEHPELALWLVEQGATVDIHAAAGLGDPDRLGALLDQDPSAIHQRGPDGQLPLHFAADIATAELLLERGAELDVRCVDHEATAAQWAVGKRPGVTRFLLERGARPDIFLAAALGDRALAERLIKADPSCLRARLGRPGYEPVQPGNILEWHLGWWAEVGGRASPHRVARHRGHEELYEFLFAASPPDVQVMVAAWHDDEDRARRVAAAHPRLVAELEPEDATFLCDAAWDNNATAVRILCEVGFDPHLCGSHQSTPLDRAAFHGFAEVIAELLKHDREPPLLERNEFGSTPLGTLAYGTWHGWRDDGDPVTAARLLIEAGAPVSPHLVEYARPDLAEILRPHADGPVGRSRAHVDEPPLDGAEADGWLEIVHEPNPTAIHEHEIHGDDERPGPWVWYYSTRIRNLSQVVLDLVWMDGFIFEHGRWAPGTGRGRAMGPAEIAELYPDGTTLAPGAEISRPVAWLTADGPICPPVKWAVVARDATGGEHWAEAEIGAVPYGVS